MTPQMKAALGARRVRGVGLAQIDFPGRTVRIADGSIAVNFGGQVFSGRDAVFGSFFGAETISEEAGDVAPGVDITLAPPAAVDTVVVADPGMQGARVRLWLAVVDDDTGAVLPEPELLFEGELDVAVPGLAKGSRIVRYEIASVFDRLLEPDEGIRLSSAHHQRIFPGEQGFDNMTSTPIDTIWGPGNRPPVATKV